MLKCGRIQSAVRLQNGVRNCKKKPPLTSQTTEANEGIKPCATAADLERGSFGSLFLFKKLT